jgi:hypothetical protein
VASEWNAPKGPWNRVESTERDGPSRRGESGGAAVNPFASAKSLPNKSGGFLDYCGLQIEVVVTLSLDRGLFS